MNAKLLSERTNELTDLLQSNSVTVKSVKRFIKVYPSKDDGEIAPLYPISQPVIEKIIEFCRINELYYYVGLDIWTEIVCITIYDGN